MYLDLPLQPYPFLAQEESVVIKETVNRIANKKFTTVGVKIFLILFWFKYYKVMLFIKNKKRFFYTCLWYLN
jgi:hypothetical protein